MGVVIGLTSLAWESLRKGEKKYERVREELRRRGRKDRERGSENFVKCFIVDFLVKYFTSFYAQTLVKLKIFYNFDFILHANKHLKIGKYLTENILH